MKRVAIANHTSNYPNPISFDVGDRLVVGRRDLEEFPGWIWVQTEDGNAGWAPDSILELFAEDLAHARQAYSARELNSNVGDVFQVIRELNGWYWVRNSNGEAGWIPIETTADTNG